MTDEPLAYFLTWTTYGTWLPGDERGWSKRRKGFQEPEPRLETWSARRLAERPCILGRRQRQLVVQTIRQQCSAHAWSLLAVTVRTNHVHAVVSAANIPPARIRKELKARCSSALNADRAEHGGPTRAKWWTDRGSIRYLNDEESLEAAVRYTNEAQDKPRE